MSLTLSKGFKKPQTGDRGSSWFPDLEHNIQQTNSHAHNGTDSELIEARHITKASATIVNSNWGADLGGSSYKQTITMPTGWTFENANMVFIDASDDSIIYPTIVKTGASSFDIFVNDNSLTITLVYH